MKCCNSDKEKAADIASTADDSREVGVESKDVSPQGDASAAPVSQETAPPPDALDTSPSPQDIAAQPSDAEGAPDKDAALPAHPGAADQNDPKDAAPTDAAPMESAESSQKKQQKQRKQQKHQKQPKQPKQLKETEDEQAANPEPGTESMEPKQAPSEAQEVAQPQEPKKVVKVLQVKVISARNLRNADWVPGTGASDPYCVCKFSGKDATIFKTKTVQDCLNPEWNHEEEIPGYRSGDSLQFSVMDEDAYVDDPLGSATLKYAEFNPATAPTGFEGELLLQGKGAGDDSKLKIHVQVAYIDKTPKKKPLKADEIAGKAKSGGEKAAAKSATGFSSKESLEGSVAEPSPSGAENEDAEKVKKEGDFFAAVEAGNMKKVTKLLKDGAKPDIFNAEGMTPLHIAASKGYEEVVGRLLLQKRIKIDAKSKESRDTPLHLAASADQKAVVVMLVREGANLKAKNAKGKTPIDVAKTQVGQWMSSPDPGSTKPPWQ